MIGQKKRLTASAARRKHSVTAAIFDCCTLICRIGEKLAVYPSQMPRVLKNISQRQNLCGAADNKFKYAMEKKQSALLLLIAFLLFEVLITIYRSYIVYFLLHLCADM